MHTPLALRSPLSAALHTPILFLAGPPGLNELWTQILGGLVSTLPVAPVLGLTAEGGGVSDPMCRGPTSQILLLHIGCAANGSGIS